MLSGSFLGGYPILSRHEASLGRSPLCPYILFLESSTYLSSYFLTLVLQPHPSLASVFPIFNITPYHLYQWRYLTFFLNDYTEL